ncbi:MAG: PIN domain-containing protein, partial [Nitrospirae bacterium]|nr:PIN domain-containing protein [Nitrospirota bacterium]
MSNPDIILDTNVLHAGLYSSRGASYQILKLIETNDLRIILSTPLLFEYEDILKRNKRRLKLTDGDIDKILDNLCDLSHHQNIYYLWRPYLSDP